MSLSGAVSVARSSAFSSNDRSEPARHGVEEAPNQLSWDASPLTLDKLPELLGVAGQKAWQSILDPTPKVLNEVKVWRVAGPLQNRNAPFFQKCAGQGGGVCRSIILHENTVYSMCRKQRARLLEVIQNLVLVCMSVEVAVDTLKKAGFSPSDSPPDVHLHSVLWGIV